MQYEKFTMFPNWIYEADLTPVEFRALIALYSFRGSTSNNVWPSLITLAKRANLPQDKSTMSKIIARLCKKGFINKQYRGHNESNTYTMKAPVGVGKNCQQGVGKIYQGGVGKNCQPKIPIEHTKEDIKQNDIKTKFETLWKKYPKKVNKKAALKAFTKIKPDKTTINEITAGLESAIKSKQWKQNNGEFIPHMSTWLNGERWNDEIKPELNGSGYQAHKMRIPDKAVKRANPAEALKSLRSYNSISH